MLPFFSCVSLATIRESLTTQPSLIMIHLIMMLPVQRFHPCRLLPQGDLTHGHSTDRCDMDGKLEDRWLSLYEIADYLGIKPGTVYMWIIRKEMPAHKAGKLWKFRKAEIDEWILSGRADDRRLKGKRSREDANNEINRDE